MTARDRHDAAFADVEGDDGDVRGGIAPPLAIGRRSGIDLGCEQILERHHAVRQIIAETAHVTDGKHVRADGHGKLAVIERADAAACDQRLGADPRQRGDGIGAATKQRQRRGDHAGAPYSERRQNILGDIGQLDSNNAVGRQPHLAQPGGDGCDDAVGLRIGEAMRRPVGKGFAVGRVDQRQRVGTAPCLTAENVVDGDGVRSVRLSGGGGRRAEDHCCARLGWYHQVSGR